MISNSGQGSTNITLQFDLSRDIDGATVDVETAIAEAMPLLPPGMPTPPSFRKVNPGDMPDHQHLSDVAHACASLIWTSMPRRWWRSASRWWTASRRCRSSAPPNTRCGCRWTRTRWRLADIGLNEVEQRAAELERQHPDRDAVRRAARRTTSQANGQLMRAIDYKPLIVTYKNGAPVRLDEVAKVIDSIEDDKRLLEDLRRRVRDPRHARRQPAVMRQPGSNTIEVTDNIKAPAARLSRRRCRRRVHLGIRGDRSKNIREAFQDIQFTMAATLALVIMVIFLFLRNFSATMIPAMALPFSIVGTFSVMYLLNFSINNISMMALILSIGFVVDDAIVMLENIVRHIEHGEKPMAGGAGRLARDRLHDRLDDAVAGGGVHPDSLHVGHSRPPLPRVRRHDLHGHPDLRNGVDQPDADAVQPVPARASQ